MSLQTVGFIFEKKLMFLFANKLELFLIGHVYINLAWVSEFVCIQQTSKHPNRSGQNFVWDLK